MEISNHKAHKAVWYMEGETFLDTKYEFTLIKTVDNSVTTYEVIIKDPPMSPEKEFIIKDIIRKHYETHGAE